MRGARPVILALAAVASVGLPGCYAHGSVGPSFSALRGDPGHHAVAGEVHIGNLFEFIGGGPTLRLKAGERLQQIALGPAVIVGVPTEWVVPYLQLGLNLIDLSWVDGVFSFGSPSPWGQLGLMIRMPPTPDQRHLYLYLSGGAEVPTLHTGRPPEDDVYATAQIGVGVLTWRSLFDRGEER